MAQIGRRRELYGFGQQWSSPLSSIADADRHARSPRHPGGVKSVLKQNGRIKPLPPQVLYQCRKAAASLVFAPWVVNNQTNIRRVIRVQLRYPRLSNHNDLRLRIAVSQELDSRQ